MLAAVLVAMTLATPALAQQGLTNEQLRDERDGCPPGQGGKFARGLLQTNLLNVTDVGSDRATLTTTKRLAEGDAWDAALDPGITKARVLMGVAEPGGKYVHYFYVLMGEFDSAKGTGVSQQTQTFLSLKPDTPYQARVFMDRVESTTPGRTYPMKQHVPLTLRCFRTGAGGGG